MNLNIFKLCLLFILLVNQAFAYDIVIKSPTNKGETNIGDYWIAEDLADGFIKSGKDVDIDYREEYHRKRKEEPKINIFMRGYTNFIAPFPEGLNILYAYYPMAYDETPIEHISKEVLNKRDKMPEYSSLDNAWQNFDVITVASNSYADKLKQNGIDAVFLPQYTNPRKFFYEPFDELKNDILFVGSNWHDRTSLRFAIESGFDVAVYGYNWYGYVPDSMYKGAYIANEDLHKYYSSAKIVLNDHRPDMKEFGFINNRIYDVTACGTMVISDYMPEIEEFYGDSIPMYKNKEELKYLLNYYLANEEERIEKAKKAQEITLKNFTNDVIAKKILEIAGTTK